MMSRSHKHMGVQKHKIAQTHDAPYLHMSFHHRYEVVNIWVVSILTNSISSQGHAGEMRQMYDLAPGIGCAKGQGKDTRGMRECIRPVLLLSLLHCPTCC